MGTTKDHRVLMTSRQAQSMVSIVDLAHLVRDLAINRGAPA
jgi:hypothetical protein